MFEKIKENRKKKKTEVSIKKTVQVIKGVFREEMLNELLKTEFANNPSLKEIDVVYSSKVQNDLSSMISSLGFDLKIDDSLKSIYILYVNVDKEEEVLTKVDCLIVDGIEEGKFASDLSEKGILRFSK